MFSFNVSDLAAEIAKQQPEIMFDANLQLTDAELDYGLLGLHTVKLLPFTHQQAFNITNWMFENDPWLSKVVKHTNQDSDQYQISQSEIGTKSLSQLAEVAIAHLEADISDFTQSELADFIDQNQLYVKLVPYYKLGEINIK